MWGSRQMYGTVFTICCHVMDQATTVNDYIIEYIQQIQLNKSPVMSEPIPTVGPSVKHQTMAYTVAA